MSNKKNNYLVIKIFLTLSTCHPKIFREKRNYCFQKPGISQIHSREPAYDDAKTNYLKPKGTCAYVAVWLKRHPEYLQ